MKEIKDLLIKTALYQKVELENSKFDLLFDLKFFSDTIDYYCIGCLSNSTYRGINKCIIDGNEIDTFKKYAYSSGSIDTSDKATKKRAQLLLNQFYIVYAECTRDRSHKSIFIFKVTDKTIEKIGQYPSLASLSQPNIKKYRAVLSKEKYKEFNRAIGLTTHGVGIGSFVYLRRIFEDLITEAHKKAQNEDNWDEVAFGKSRMAEKIKMLKNYLPTFLNENKTVYDILSKGVHELSEDECLQYFPIMKACIELMLDEKLRESEQKKKEQEAKKALSAIKSKVGKKDDK